MDYKNISVIISGATVLFWVSLFKNTFDQKFKADIDVNIYGNMFAPSSIEVKIKLF